MGKPLSDRTRQLLELLPDPSLREKVCALFESDGALYGPPTDKVLERVRFAVIKLAMEGEEMFAIAAELFRTDARDLLVTAEFADGLTAHEQWCDSMLKPQ